MRILALLAALAVWPAHATSVAETATAYFAGGCFWCTEADFEKLPGVTAAESGYMGGSQADPSYEEVSAGRTGHTEAVRVTYHPGKVSYEELLKHFWRTIDPLTPNAQFCDHGPQYRSAIFVRNAHERALAESSKEAVAKQLGKKVVTEINDAGPFYPAESYHQDYYKKNPVRYKFYRTSCGRDAALKKLWGAAANP